MYNYNSKEECILITCGHVLKRRELYLVVKQDTSLKSTLKNKGHNYIKMGSTVWKLDGEMLRTKITLKKDSNYVIHDSLDIGAFLVGLGTKTEFKIGDSTITVPLTKTTGITRNSFTERKDIELGTDIYFVGFPFGIGKSEGYLEKGLFSDKVPTPLVRSGIIAWISDTNKEFLLDAFSYGGNSGSPVFTKRSFSRKGPLLVGMVIGHLGVDITNFGLVRCVWFDDIEEVINKLLSL